MGCLALEETPELPAQRHGEELRLGALTGYLVVHVLDPDHYTDLSFLDRRYTVILCVSLVQFYRDLQEVAALFTAIGQVARPGARVLIADLPTGPLGPLDLGRLLCLYLEEQ